jgi:hypothetical protein
MVERRPGGQGFTTDAVVDQYGIAHGRCADAEAIANRLTSQFVGGLLDTRELPVEARPGRINVLVEDLRDAITTALIGAGNRAGG